MENGILRVVIADDSRTIRALLRQWLAPEHGFEVVGEAANGRECAELVNRLRPSIVVTDMEMPEMDGVAATREIMCTRPTPILIFTSSDVDERRGVFADALAAGALDVFHKPSLTSDAEMEEAAVRFRKLLRILAPIMLIRRCAPIRAAIAPPPSPILPPRAGGPVRVLALAASTGGPAALVSVLKKLPAGFPAPVLAVQHMSPEFVAGFAEWLGQNINLPVAIPAQNEALRPGVVFVAPGDTHMRLGGGWRVNLDRSAPLNSCRPSADALFSSVADVAGPEAVGVILTGMGEDGARGLLQMRRKGAVTVAQSEGTCVVYGMPKAAADGGAAARVLDLEEIGGFLAESFAREAGR
ncbi:MAG: chemotaxis-specific protein-glutamate methyltransferase CheB [Elusimicrobiales bacterium]|nr:chemotaxis-specific protein-glutamate methyltransferase CheB [Elusimicrobiales bacterium]